MQYMKMDLNKKISFHGSGHSRQLKEYFKNENYYNYLVYKRISFLPLKAGGGRDC